MQCPFCGSTHVQSYQVVRSQGTMRVEAEHVGLNGPYAARSEGLVFSELARHCAPPAPPSPMGFIIATPLGAYVTYQSLRGFGFVYWPGVYIGAGIVGLGWVLFVGYRTAANYFRDTKRLWLRSYLCLTCGQTCLTPE
jgi:hypothetical protein